MQILRLAPVLLLLAGMAAEAAVADTLDFSSAAPASLDGHALAGSALQWVMLISPPGQSFQVRASLPHDGIIENFTAIRDSLSTDQGDGSGTYSVGRTGMQAVGPFSGQLESAAGAWSSVYIEAKNITFDVAGFDAAVAVTDGYHTVAGALDAWAPSGVFRPEVHPAVGEAVLLLDPNQVRHVLLHVQDVRVVEWHNATWRCSSRACPSAPADEGAAAAARPLGVYPLEYRRLSTSAGDVDADAQVLGLAAAGAGFDLVASGSLRLPRIVYGPNCPDPCGDSTFQADGRWGLRGLHPTPDGRLAGHLSGDFAAARLDEADVLALLTGTAAQAVAGIGLAAILAVAAGKFGRVGLEALAGLNVAEPLGNRQRVLVLAAVAQNPGIDQSELASKANVARGTIRHHLRILLRADLLAERHIGKRNTYTLNDSSFEFPASTAPAAPTAGTAVASLRHPHRKALVRALQKGGEMDFQTLQDFLQGEGIQLPRATANYHLQMLERGGLVERRRCGARVLWKSRLDLEDLVSKQRHRFLTIGRLQSVLDALPPTPIAPSTLRDRLHAQGWRGNLREVTAKLDLLAATGYVQRSDFGYSRLVH